MHKEQHLLSDHANFTSGVLQTRISDTVNDTPSKRMIFNPLAETSKFIHGTSKLPVIHENEVAISMLQRLAFLVKPQTNIDDLILTANFTAMTFDETIDPEYFIWWFNSSLEAQSQLQERGQIGRRIVIRDLRELKITLPGLSVQKDIAKIYQNSMKTAALYRKLAETTEEKSRQFIQQYIAKELSHE